MSVESDLTTRIKAQVAGISNRFYPLEMPENPTLPAGVYQRISTSRHYAHAEGELVQDPRFQLTFWGTYSEVMTIKWQVKAALTGWTSYPAIFIVNEGHEYDKDLRIWAIVLDVIIWNNE